MDGNVWAVFLLSTLTATVQAGEYCVTDEYPTYFEYEYCAYGCCGDFPNQMCCAPYVWVIAVGAVGAFIFMLCIIGVICCFVNLQKKRKGLIVNEERAVPTVAFSNRNPEGQTYFYGFQQPRTDMVPNQALHPPTYQQPGPSANQAFYPPTYQQPGSSTNQALYPPTYQQPGPPANQAFNPPTYQQRESTANQHPVHLPGQPQSDGDMPDQPQSDGDKHPKPTKL